MLTTASQAQILTIESEYLLQDSYLDWTSEAVIKTVFTPLYGEQSERPFFAALGTLASSRAQLFADTLTRTGAVCLLPAGCADSTSELYFVHAATQQFIGVPTLTFTGQGQFIASNYPPPEVGFFPSYQGRMENISGWQVTSPGSESLHLQHRLNLAPGVQMQGDAFLIKGELSLTQTYVPHSVGRYIQDGVRAATANGATTNLSAAAAAAGYVRVLRTTSGETSGSNTRLRDAEYMLYGYGAGLALRSGQVFNFSEGSKGNKDLDGFIDTPLIQTPAGTGAYFVVKQFARQVPGLKSAWTTLFGAPPGQTTQLPATTDFFGGVGSNQIGIRHALRGNPVTTLGGCLIASDCGGDDPVPGPNLQQRAPASAAMAGLSAADQTLLISSDATVVDGSTVNAALYALADTQAAQVLLPLPAFDDHLFAAIGGGFAGFQLLVPAAATGTAWLAVTDGVQDILQPLGEGPISFIDLLGQPVQSFALFGLDGSKLIADQASIELRFAGTSPEFIQTVSISAVPEPTAAVLLLLGLATLGARRQAVFSRKR